MQALLNLHIDSQSAQLLHPLAYPADHELHNIVHLPDWIVQQRLLFCLVQAGIDNKVKTECRGQHPQSTVGAHTHSHKDCLVSCLLQQPDRPR